jgi:hypothetical protein
MLAHAWDLRSPSESQTYLAFVLSIEYDTRILGQSELKHRTLVFLNEL